MEVAELHLETIAGLEDQQFADFEDPILLNQGSLFEDLDEGTDDAGRHQQVRAVIDLDQDARNGFGYEADGLIGGLVHFTLLG